jgi:hypothetical protein
LGAAGLYALSASRSHAPGSVVGKRIVAGVGVCEHSQFLFLANSFLRFHLGRLIGRECNTVDTIVCTHFFLKSVLLLKQKIVAIRRV